MLLAMLVNEYIRYMEGIRRYSPRTVTVYSEILEKFTSFAGARDDGTLLESLTPQILRSYEVMLMDSEKLDPRTVNLHLSVLSGFCRDLVRQGSLASNTVRLVHRPRERKRLPEFYRSESMNEYFDATASEASAENVSLVTGQDKVSRELVFRRLSRLVVSLLYSPGMRRSELIGANLGDVDFSREAIRVRGKGDKEREIPLTHGICKEILLYLETVGKFEGRERTAGEPLLQTLNGKRLYPVFVDRAVKRELGQVGSITGRKSPHVLRHSLATALLNEGTDLNSIKELLGHSSLAATQVYTHNSVSKLKKVYQTAHPRAKSGGKNGT